MVKQINNNQETSLVSEAGGTELQPAFIESKSQGKALSEVFSQDKIEKPSPSLAQKTVSNWLWNLLPGTTKTDQPKESTMPIGYAPVLPPPPDSLHDTLKKTSTSLPLDQLDNMDKMSVEDLIMVLVESLKLIEELVGKGAQEHYERIQKLREVQHEALAKIKENMRFDQKVGDYFGYAQKALAGGTLAATAAVFFTGGMALPAVVPIIAAGMGFAGAAATAGDKYFEYREREESKHRLEMEYARQIAMEAVKEQLDRISNCLEQTQSLDEILVNMINRHSDIVDSIIESR